MNELFAKLTAIFSGQMLVAVAIGSLIAFVTTLVAIPFILIRLPANYFDVRVQRTWMQGHHPALRLIGQIVKNVAGFIFLLAGLSMLILPGQGVLTILIAISLLDFPGKQQLEAKIIGQRPVLNAVNALRGKFGRPPLVLAPKL
jgi:Putative transmembrane protein (PGPGW)